MAGTSIPQPIIPAMIFIIALDDRQLLPVPTPGTFRWALWHWTKEESEYWTALREILEPLLQKYSNKKTITTDERNQVKITIKAAREFVGYGVNGHRLWLKIAAFGDDTDWATANVKFGTPLAKTPGKGKSDSTDMLLPELTIRHNIIGQQELHVVNPNTPNSVKLPKGMRFVNIFRYIGSVAPTKTSQFESIGNAYRGKFVSKLGSVETSGVARVYAYHIARYESNKGELGEFCAMESAEILIKMG